MGGCSRPPAAFVRRAWCAWVPRVRICAHVWRREDEICDVGERDARGACAFAARDDDDERWRSGRQAHHPARPDANDGEA